MARAVDMDSALLALFSLLNGYGISRIREYDLHVLASRIAPRLWPQVRFITKPTVYSPALHTHLHDLERQGAIDEVILVHDAWSPRHEYELTRLGKIRATDAVEKLETFSSGAISELDKEARSMAANLWARQDEKDSSYPAEYS